MATITKSFTNNNYAMNMR